MSRRISASFPSLFFSSCCTRSRAGVTQTPSPAPTRSVPFIAPEHPPRGPHSRPEKTPAACLPANIHEKGRSPRAPRSSPTVAKTYQTTVTVSRHIFLQLYMANRSLPDKSSFQENTCCRLASPCPALPASWNSPQCRPVNDHAVFPAYRLVAPVGLGVTWRSAACGRPRLVSPRRQGKRKGRAGMGRISNEGSVRDAAL